jgi:DNA polymerase-3 subunit delta
MEFNTILRDLENKNYKPIYFLMGEESYYIDLITDYIASNILDESEKALNQIVFYGRDTTVTDIINTARKYPMMASHQVVIVKEAQTLTDIDNLSYYAEAPLHSTILVINYKYKTLDGRKKLSRIISAKGILFESKKIYDDKVPGWITNWLKERKKDIELKASVMLAEFLGNDLGKIVNELEKLIITLPEGSDTITAEHIEKNIGISKDYNNFELNKALIQKNVLKANRIINYFAINQNNNPMYLTISSLYYFFSRVLLYHHIEDKSKKNVASVLNINPFFISDYELAARTYTDSEVVRIISLLREYDLKSKGYGNVSIPPGELLKELVYRILH